MTSLLPRLSAALVGAAVVLVPTGALAAGPGEAPAGRAAQAGPGVLPSPAAAAAGAATGAASGAGAAVGAAGGVAAGRSAVQAPVARAAAPAARAAEVARPRAGERGAPAAGSVGKAARVAPVKPARVAPVKPARVAPVKPAGRKAAKPATPARAGRPEPARKPAPGKKAVPATKPSVAAAKADDPRGNNGTFKVDGPVLDTSHGNEPQVDCAFRLNFYGYDAGQLATIVFTPIAPTPGASTSVSGRQLISSDPAKGGQYNGSYPVTGTWTAADLGLDPTVRQHVKVSVESLNADGSDVPGGAKHKVFWLHPCGATAPVEVSSAGVPQAPMVGPRSISAAPAAQPAVAPAAVPVMGPQVQVLGLSVTAAQTAAQAAAVQTVSAQSAGPAQLLPTQAVAAGTAQPRSTAATSTPPAVLPFTGSPQLLALLVGGLIALLGGTAMVAAARTSA